MSSISLCSFLTRAHMVIKRAGRPGMFDYVCTCVRLGPTNLCLVLFLSFYSQAVRINVQHHRHNKALCRHRTAAVERTVLGFRQNSERQRDGKGACADAVWTYGHGPILKAMRIRVTACQAISFALRGHTRVSMMMPRLLHHTSVHALLSPLSRLPSGPFVVSRLPSSKPFSPLRHSRC